MAAVDRNAVLHTLNQQGTNLKQWAAENGYGYRNASNVLRGINRANYGAGKDIADKLNKLVREAA